MKIKRLYCVIPVSVITAGILFTVYGCNNHKDKPAVPLVCQSQSSLTMPAGYRGNTLYTIIFLDYTDNRIMGDPSCARVRNLLRERLVSPGDRVDIFLITSNTATRSGSADYSFSLNIRPRAEIIPYATTDSVKKSKVYACKRLQAIDSAIRLLDNKFSEIGKMIDTISYDNSDIAALFFIANRMLKDVSQTFDRKMVIISDLEQNCDGFFRLNNTRFSSLRGIAIGDAEADFRSIISQGVNPSFFTKVKLAYHPGDTPEMEGNNSVKNDVLKYWRELFLMFDMQLN